jgi:hypothetical protein
VDNTGTACRAPKGRGQCALRPYFFRTDFLDTSSLPKIANHIADYDGSVGKTRELATERNHAHPGDPSKLGQALLQIVNSPEPRVRLPLGTDALRGVLDKLEFVVIRRLIHRVSSGWFLETG